MTYWATSGIAWDGQPWILAPALVTFASQMAEIRPSGPYTTDGTVASRAHDANNPSSDHTVWPKTGEGVVYAIDVAEQGGVSIDEIWEQLRVSQDPRIKYAIHAFNDTPQLFSSYPARGFPPYTWRPYSGYNPHTSHGHLSIHHDDTLANDASRWEIGTMLTPEEREALDFWVKTYRELKNDIGIGPPEGTNEDWASSLVLHLRNHPSSVSEFRVKELIAEDPRIVRKGETVVIKGQSNA